MEKIINFSEIVKKYKIKCYDEKFHKIIINKFENIEKTDEEIDSETLLIGISCKIKIINNLNILILGYELNNKKILDYFLRNKNRINFFSLSALSSNYYLKNFGIYSNIIYFDYPNTNEKSLKLVYFNQKDIIEFENHSNNFINFIRETDNIFNILELKLIIFEEIVYIWDPYVNILYESFFESIKIINFYQLNSNIYMKKFIDLPKNIMNKFIFIKMNIEYIKKYVEFICSSPNQIKYLYSSKKYDNLGCSCQDIDKSLVIISDDLHYLDSIVKKDVCKIYISNEEFCSMKNNIVHINEKFISNKVSNEHKECKNISFILVGKNDAIFLQDYI